MHSEAQPKCHLFAYSTGIPLPLILKGVTQASQLRTAVLAKHQVEALFPHGRKLYAPAFECVLHFK